jgi:polyketide synthase PksN
VITGGLGGLGLIFARFLATQYQARLVLSGRSASGPESEARVRELEALGAEVMYCQADVSCAEDVERLVAGAKARFHELNGLIHAAGVLRDAMIPKKTAADMEAVLASKVYGTVNLDAATKGDSVDLFVVFSSQTAITGNVGQTDYAYGNSFMDAFVSQRNEWTRDGHRSGRAISLNWPLWKDGGMRITQEAERYLKDALGIEALHTDIGLGAFQQALAGSHEHLLVMQGEATRVRRLLGIVDSGETREALSRPVTADGASGKDAILTELLRRDLLRIVAKVSLVDENRITPDVDLIEYGFDSIGVAKLFSEINEGFGIDLVPAVFFEYPTFESLSGFLLQEHRAAVEHKFREQLEQACSIEPERIEAPRAFEDSTDRTLVPAQTPTRGEAQRFDVAVVGMSGVFPQSDNLQAFWENIVAERDLITVVPSERWDWSLYQGNPFQEKNKTNSKWGGFLTDADKFDAMFFGITPREAELMDPQQRIFTQTVWAAIEDAGHKPSDLAGTRTCIYVGVGGFDYLELLRESKTDVVGYTATGNSHCVLPNRISYLLDVHGPSEPVDTACSSSLVAVHRAVEAIATGQCEMAITGGVNLLLSPALYLAFGNAGMLAGDGRCKTFDKRADGYVRGEGSGALLLKRLDRAIADGNPIHGVIKASGINHGGRATSLTAPNPNAQAELLVDVYEKAGIDPNMVGYIEAHGTGTALGDPAEINALKKAFKELYRRRGVTQRPEPFCGIGSVKTNIGHLETAAGVAGLIKLLLALRHQKLPGSIHCNELNPHIRLDGSPFFVVNHSREWPRLKDETGREYPRTAGVSSFGFGGANAHVIVQEYLPPDVGASSSSGRSSGEPVLIPLSARRPEQLLQKTRDLLAYLRQQPPGPEDLANIAYTLQIGRQAMEERVGFVVRSVQDLCAKLEGFVNGTQPQEDTYRGQVKNNRETLRVVSQDPDIREMIVEKWVKTGKLANLLELWSKGLDFDWHKLHRQHRPKRVSLPLYPFAKERYWVARPEGAGGGESQNGTPLPGILHPLLHRDTSDPTQISFQSEFFAADALLQYRPLRMGFEQAQAVLPEVACLEMARAALSEAIGVPAPASQVELRDIIWMEPVTASGSVLTTVYTGEGGQIEYEILTRLEQAEGSLREIIHSRGVAATACKVPATNLALAALKARLQVAQVSSAEVYAVLGRLHGRYGGAYRAIDSLLLGEREGLAHLVLRSSHVSTTSELVLHPSLLEGAVQAGVYLLLGQRTGERRAVPLSLERISIYAPCKQELFAWIRYSESNKPGTSAPRLDIDLCDPQGNLCASLRSLQMLLEWAGDTRQQGAAGVSSREGVGVALRASSGSAVRAAPDIQAPPALQ